MFGYTADEMIGRSILTLIPELLRHEEDEILRKLRAGQRVDHYETTQKESGRANYRCFRNHLPHPK